MKRKRQNKERKKGVNTAAGNNDSPRESGRKKTTKKSETSTPAQSQSQHRDPASRSEDQAKLQEPDRSSNRPEPEKGKVEAQTQTVRPKVKTSVTQTDSVKLVSRHTQTESAQQTPQPEPAGGAVEREPTQPDRGNAEDEKNEGKDKKNVSNLNVKMGEEKGSKSEKVPQPAEGLQKSSDPGSAEKGPKSYAAAASSTEPPRGLKEKKDQAAGKQEGRTQNEGKQRKTSPERGPTGQPAFTFFVHIIVDKGFRFNRDKDKLLLIHDGGRIELDITYFRGLREKGYLIEAKFSVDECNLQRDSTISYKYAVLQRQNVIPEIALRQLWISFGHSKEIHLFEAHMSRPGLNNWLRSWIKSADKVVTEAWENSAHFLLDRLFETWKLSNQDNIHQFIQHLNSYKCCFLAARRRVLYSENVTTPVVKVPELIAQKLVNMLNEVREQTERPSTTASPLMLGLSVFQVCCACEIELGIKDWGKICQLVSSGAAQGQLGEIQHAFPTLQKTVLGLMIQCARKLVSELVLLVPVLHTLRQPGADANRLGSTVEETDWAGLQYVEYRPYRERIKTLPDKRSMMLQMVQEHKSLAKENPQILTSWLSMMAFEDMIQFATLTGIVPEYLVQSLMYRLNDVELYLHNINAAFLLKLLELTEEILRYVLKGIEQDIERIRASKRLDGIFQCCGKVLTSTCRIARQNIQMFQAGVLSFRLVLKLAEIQYEVLSESGEERDQEKARLLSQLENMQKDFIQWRDGLLRQPLFHQSALSYPKEIELWDSLFGLKCSIQGVTEPWISSLETDLRKRISELSEVQKIQVYCVETSAMAIAKSHGTIQTCFQEMCLCAVKTICQAGKEGDLLRTLLSWPKPPHSSILSSIIVESAAHFGEDTVTQLLDAQSAVHVLLSKGDWNQRTVNEDACHIMQKCQSTLDSLVTSLCQGSIPLGQLQTILKHQNDFQKVYKNYKNHSKLENISIEAEALLAQREKDLQALNEQRTHIDALLKMIGKISEMIYVPEISILEEEHKTDLQALSLNELLSVQPCFSEDDLRESSTGQVLYYTADLMVLDTARQMHELRESNLLLSLWVDRATERTSVNIGSDPMSLNLVEVISEIWQPSLRDFSILGIRIAQGFATFEEVDKVLDGCGDEGDGTKIKKELHIMAIQLKGYQDLKENWPELRLCQIQEYRQLYHAAEAANTLLRIRDRLSLRGDFSHIYGLTELREISFKQKTLGSLSDDLISAKNKLSNVKHQHTACLEAFLESEKLVYWVKSCIENPSELKFFMNLAGESDADIDRLASFRDAVTGYSALLYSLPERAGFEQLLARAQQVWDNLQNDEKLATKLKDSCRWLDWLKSVRETYGSVEQSSLSLASAINAQGVYHVKWPVDSSGKKCLDSVLHVNVLSNEKDKKYYLDDLLELQNKLMLMSSKGECGKEQVYKFTEIFEGVQRMGRILLQLCSSGNIFFRNLEALIKCNPEGDPCINVHCPLLGKHIVYHGHVAEQLQKVCRSMEVCHENWCSFISDMRSRFYALNHYTSEQIVYLCNWIRNICVKGMPVPQQIWYLMYPLKPSCSLNDIREAFARARKSIDLQGHRSPPLTELDVEDYAESVDSMDIQELTHHDGMCITDQDKEERVHSEDMLEEHLEDLALPKQQCEWSIHQPHTEEEEDISALELETFSDEPESEDDFTVPEPHSSPQARSYNMEKTATETLDSLWSHFRNDMVRYLTQYVDIETLALFLSSLSDMNQAHIKRKLPSILQEGKPNLVHCPAMELISTTLSVYMESPEQTFPSVDEVLMCKEDTSEEDVEIFLRRCLGRGAPSSHQKIYTVVNPGLLTYDVSVALAEHFEAMEKSARAHYRIVMICPVNQDRYVPSFFSSYKVQGGLIVSGEKAKEYLRCHLTVPVCHGGHFQIYPEGLSAWMITSKRAAVGKSLYIRRMFQNFEAKLPAASYLPLRLIEPLVDTDCFVLTLSEKLREQDPVLLHIDAAAVRCGLEEFLFKLLVLGCLSDGKGQLWRRNPAHLIAVEALLPDPTHHRQTLKEPNQGLLHLLPTIHCRPPKEIKELELKKRNYRQNHASLDPLMDIQEFQSEGIQRSYQYLRRFNRNENLDHFKYQAKSVEGSPVDCLHHLLSNCGLKDPSWAELKHFTWFLNLQLKDCENSGFCDPDFFAQSLHGFKSFIVKFMIHMARDFASPSLDISDQSPSLLPEGEPEDDLLYRLTIRKQWENQSHPYIFFNADHLTMTFLGFHVKQMGATLNAVDPHSGKVLMGNVMSPDLFVGLKQQRISFSEDFDQLPREKKIRKISLVVGAKEWFDPDPTYELTADNVMKMLAIHMRFRCEIPVIIMGETGCGKTRLVKFLCDLQREGRNVENMKLVKVHGGTTADIIYKKVREAERLAVENRRKHSLDTILFFDEANTTEAIFAIKEVLCDMTVQGFPLKKNSGLKIIAACNPYRRHTAEMIERLERAGLGYRVKAGETEDRLGKVPMRQLVYRVHPLPPSMIPLVWDFGQLSDSTEFSYIRQIVLKQMNEHHLPLECQTVITNVLATSQSYMRGRVDECSFVSLRDVERSMMVLVWFYQHRGYLFPDHQGTGIVYMTLKCLALALGVCYYPSLECRETYLATVSKHFREPLNTKEALKQEISSCQDFFLKNISMRQTIAKNSALKENVFLMVVCIELRIPLFLVGKPGSSKSLAKTVVADAMQRQASHCDLFKKLKETHMVSFQCSPHSSPEGIIATFRNCARFQKDKNLDEYVSVVVLDEIGLAEDSPQMPLKTLHPLLEDGCIDNERPDPHMKVGFVGISNWALDPAKMNRGIFVSRWDPSENELVETANGICASSKSVFLKIKHLLPKLAKGFLSICENDSDQFFGLRDYYSLVKMIFATVKNTDKDPSDSDLAEAVLRNFSGQKNNFDPLSHFQDLFFSLHDVPRTSTLKMIEQNLDETIETRYLLLLSTNNAALYIVQRYIFSKGNYTCPEIVFGSGFPKDQEYAQICRNVSRVKTCMETGRTVILLNLLNLYESLYDALNQYYVTFSGQQYVDLGLGSHRVKCRVHRDFRLVVIEDQEKVYDKFPVPLKNRLEKHRVDRSTDLTPWQHRVLGKLQDWVKKFSNCRLSEFSPMDAFVGFHGDACASALLQALERRENQDHVATDVPEAKDNIISEPMDEDSMTMTTGNGMKESQTQREGVVSQQIRPGDDDENALIDSRVQSDDDSSMLPDEKDEDHAMIHVDDSAEVATEVEKDAENLEEILKSEQMDIDPVDLETVKYNEPDETKNEEEEVYESAKHFLLKCATPDSVLRLKYSWLGKQEVDRLQRLYFHQQGQHTFKDFMSCHLMKKDKEKSRFIEVTTFSSLLTKADVRNLTRALGLSMEQLLLLSLHQFDTEASFCRKIRSFVQNTSLSLRILLIEMDMEESLCKNELIASAKYCTMNELLSLGSEDCNCYVVFITKLSRIAGGNKYIGFQGGAWLSVHVDDLRDTDDMSMDLSVFCGTPISKVFSQTTLPDVEVVGEHQETAMPKSHWQKKSVYLHSLSLVKSCTQKAVSLLRDPTNKASRSMKRMSILLDLLGNDPGEIAARFQKVLLRRLVVVLTQREELIPNSGDWVNKEAAKREALQEGGTLRHTLWRCLQGVLTPVLARVLEVLDRDSNLDLLYDARLSEGLIQFWLDIFSDQHILDLTPPQNSSATEQDIDVQCNLLLGVEERSCTAPFSWLIRLYCHNLWEESQFVQGTEQNSKERIQQFVSAVTGSSLGSYIEKLSERERAELAHKYLNDFVLLSFKVKTEEEMRVFSAAVLGCVSALQELMGVTPDLSPAWIMAAAWHYSPRLDTLSHTLQLQPCLAPLILNKQPFQKDLPDMCEDILALGICVEETKLQPITAFSECESFLSRVELLQPCLQRALSYSYSSLCSPGSQKHLNAIKSVWQGMLVMAAFIEQVMAQVNPSNEKLVALTVKHCSQLQRLMEECPDLQSKASLQQLIRILNEYHEKSISRELRFGVKCPVCLLDLSEPCVLPCEHVFCLQCVKRCLKAQEAKSCPKCRTDLDPSFQATVSASIQLALKEHRSVRRCCNSFFLEVVSRFCLSEGQRPQEDMVELLFSLLISAQGDVYKTRELTPFLECVDQSPVVRSVLPKLLLQYSFDQVKDHIQTYLENLEDKLLDREDRTELYRLFANCFQDSLLCPGLSGTLEVREFQLQQQDISFLGRLARNQTPSREHQPAEFLLSMARLRVCLDTTARILPRAVGQKSGGCSLWEQKLLEQVKAVCEYSGNDWYRVYVLRALNRQAGIDCVQALMNSTPYAWVFPTELLRLQRLVPAEVDRFLCCGPLYQCLRNGVAQVLLDSSTDALHNTLQDMANASSGSSVLLSLALFRRVTCRLFSPDSAIHPGAQKLDILKDLVRRNTVGHLRDLCTSLLSNQPVNLVSQLYSRARESAEKRLLLELVVHANAVFHSGSRLLHPLHLIATRPQTMTEAFLPTMPDDNTSVVRKWLNETNLKMYLCRNGHPCLVGECGKPVALAKCDTCGVPIGGENHRPVDGFTPLHNTSDRTRPGHILGQAANRSEAPNRDLTMAQSSVLRLCLHLAMLQGSAFNHQGISAMIHPNVSDVYGFLWHHLEKDMEALGKTLNLNWDDTAVTVHLILCASAHLSTARVQQGAAQFSSRQTREEWEKEICRIVINPIIRDLDKHLREAQERIIADEKLSDSTLMTVLKGDPSTFLPLPSDCPSQHSAFWTPPDPLTVERLSQLITQKQSVSPVPLLSLFISRVQCIRQLACLPDLAALLSDLIRVVPAQPETVNQTIASLLLSMPAGHQKNTLTQRVKTFCHVWNHLRMELSNNGVSPELCGKDITMESSAEYLSLSRHGPGSCLYALIDLLSETHNSLVREARKLRRQDDSDYSLPLGVLSETQLAFCHPEKELLPLVLAHCNYTLVKGQQTSSDYDVQAIERQLNRRFLAGKPRIQADTEKYLKRHHQDFSEVLKDVRIKIPQVPLKGSVNSSMRTVLRSFTEVCNAVYVLEIGLRFLGKTGGRPESQLLSYLQKSLRMEQDISSNVAKALAESRLDQSTATWQLLTCWRSELKLRKGQEPFPRLSDEYKQKMTVDEKREVKDFLDVTDVELFTLELHEILLLKADSTSQNGYSAQWDIRSTMESHLEEKGAPALPGLESLQSSEITLSKAAEIWRLAVELKT
ncbi:E3 ubiquitin-protein ligase rnf213-beta [Salminus brasiliensis]|uniref:E3 ubiquitin-protein ligase rnf213-beta n=1 Tax=Salminus brasiliensis TaxID=930266 RepID=UPI003B82F69F